MRKFCLGLIFLAGVSGCKAGAEKGNHMASKDEVVKIHCLGRHLFELPSSFVASPITNGIFKFAGRGPQDPAYDVVVHAAEVTPAQFALDIARRRIELTKRNSDTSNVLRFEKKLSDEATLFRVQVIDDAYVSEIDLLSGSHTVTVRLESYENQYLLAEESLIKFVAGISATPAGADAGFCLGPVVIKGNFTVENGSFLFRNGAGADFDIDIDTYTRDDRETLLQRMAGPESLLSIFDVRHSVLRRGERTVSGMRAQEWLGSARVTEEQDAKKLKFALETMRPNPSKATPGMTVTFDTAQPLEDGTPTKTLMSDEEAMRLWDKVIHSIRPVGTGSTVARASNS
jgi:hypothetical protein